MTLADRIEQHDGPDRNLDAEIAIATGWQLPAPMGGCIATLKLRNHLAGPVEAGKYWLSQRSGDSLRTAPAYTASVDAALTLVPDGSSVHMHLFPRYTTNVVVGVGNEATAATPALAICAAAMRAKSA